MKRASSLVCSAAIMSLVTASVAARAAPPIVVSDFDLNAEDWFVQDIEGIDGSWNRVAVFAVNHVEAGGTPAGHIYATDRSKDFFQLSAPAKFLGDKSDYLGGSLAFDLAHEPGGSISSFVILRGGIDDEILAFQTAGVVPSTFRQFEVVLDADGVHWMHFDNGHANQRIAVSADFQRVLQNLTDCWIQGDLAPGNDLTRLDNVRLLPACLGDANGDFHVYFDDISVVLANWLTTYVGTGPGDANRDGTVNFEDINLVLTMWLSECD